MSASEDLTADRTPQAGELVRVGAVAELASKKGWTVLDVAGTEVLVVTDGSRFYAFRNLCTHREVWMDHAIVYPESGELRCPAHDGRFDLRTGAPTKLPCLRPVETFEIKVLDGDVFVVARASVAEPA